MRNIVKAAIAAGPAGVLTLGGGVLFAQHELHYLLRPSVIETIAGIGAVVGGILWSAAARKRKAGRDETRDDAAAIEAPRAQALPQATQHFLSDGVVEQRIAQMARSLQKH